MYQTSQASAKTCKVSILNQVLVNQSNQCLLICSTEMKLVKPRLCSEPFQHFDSIKFSLGCCAQRMIGRPRPGAEIGHKPMLLRVAMDVENQVQKVMIRRDLYSPEPLFKHAARAAIGFVDGFGIGVEKIGKVLSDLARGEGLTGFRI